MKRNTEREFEIFMRNLSRLRRSRGLSKQQMAKLLGISVKTWNKIEKGEFPPRLSVNVMEKVYRHFGVTPSGQFIPWPEEILKPSRSSERDGFYCISCSSIPWPDRSVRYVSVTGMTQI